MIDYTLPLDELPDPLPIVPLEKPFDVTITPPGSKSITNRAYVLAALAEGESRIIRPLRAEDTDLLLAALCTLGAEAKWEGEDVLIRGVSGRFPRGGSVYLGDGGTPTRFMIAAACLAAEPVVVDGSKRMRERPIAEGVEMLRQLGAKIEYVEEEGRLPVRVVPSEAFKGGELRVGKTASSQFISAVMLIAPWLSKGVSIRYNKTVTSWEYVLLSIQELRARQVVVENELASDCCVVISTTIAPKGIVAAQATIESDASSSAYWLAAAATVRGACVEIDGLPANSAQPDLRIAPILEEAGAWVRWTHENSNLRLSHRAPLNVFHGELDDMPDGAMALAAIFAVAKGRSRITGLHTLRVKETDRLAALANELRKVGCAIETTEDSITITPPAEPGANGVVIETYNDHRMAMSFAVLGLVRPGISIRNPKCVAKSYPTFWKDFAKLYE